ncbi:MAG: DUF975 family protein [Lachnospiraceae bacterium]|nr:DUF975 family protein [Lachnospiraceae bacterium]
MLTISEYKSDARATLLGNYSVCVAAILLGEAISAVASMVFLNPGRGSFGSLIYLVSSLILLLLTGILHAGYKSLYLHIARKQEAAVTDIFFCFRNHADRALYLLAALIAINLVCSLPFLVLMYFISGMRITGDLSVMIPLANPGRTLLIAAAWACFLILVDLRFAPVFYLFADDPYQSTTFYLFESQRLMQGNMLRFLKLQLSFLGYALLCLLTFGIGLLWLIPYIHVSNARFYDTLDRNSEPDPFEESAYR